MLSGNFPPTYRTIVFFLLMFAINLLLANNGIDYQLKLLQNSKKDTNRIKVLNELAFLYSDLNQLEEAEQYALEACSLTQKLSFLRGQGDCPIRLGLIAEKKGDYDSALSFYFKGLRVREKSNNKKWIASALNNIGKIYMYKDDYDEALKFFQKGLAFLKTIKNTKVEGSLRSNLSEIFFLKGKYKIALVEIDSCIQIWKNLEEPREISNRLLKKSEIFLKLNKNEDAKRLVIECLEIFNKEKDDNGKARCLNSLGNIHYYLEEDSLALSYYKKAFALKKYLNVNDQAILHYNLATIYQGQKNYPLALENYHVSAVVFETLESSEDLAYIHYERGNINKTLKNYEDSKSSYIKSLTYIQDDFAPDIQKDVLYNLSDIYLKLGELDSAYHCIKEYSILNDSTNYYREDAIKYQLDLEEKENKNIQLRAENQRKNFLNILLFVGGLFLIVMLYAYHNRQKTKEAYLEIDDLLRDQELAIAYARLDEKDVTQKQIGQDLHDSLGATLATIKLYFADINKNQHKTLELLDEASAEVRRISHSMQSGMLKKFGLTEAVKELAGKINDSNQLKVKVYAHGLKQRIPNDLEFKLYKIIQELVGNVLKHAKASQLTISLTKQEELLNIIVEDNGVGFNLNQVAEKDGLGLKTITYRVTELGGICHFDTVKGRGTNVIIDIPMKTDS